VRRHERLTDKQRAVLASIDRMSLRSGRPPSRRALCGAFHVTTNAIQWHVNALTRKGFLLRGPHKARALTIDRRIDGPDVLVRGRWVPLLAVTIAGEPGSYAWEPEGVGR
jgi:SOS-response transcriptional repressor LexA